MNVVVRAGAGDLWDVIVTITEEQSAIAFTKIIGALAESTLPDLHPSARYHPFSGPPTRPPGNTPLSPARTVQSGPVPHSTIVHATASDPVSKAEALARDP